MSEFCVAQSDTKRADASYPLAATTTSTTMTRMDQVATMTMMMMTRMSESASQCTYSKLCADLVRSPPNSATNDKKRKADDGADEPASKSAKTGAEA